jgi:hypothetical protein
MDLHEANAELDLWADPPVAEELSGMRSASLLVFYTWATTPIPFPGYTTVVSPVLQQVFGY